MHDQSLPAPWFTRHASLVAAGARLLDVACGTGRHARFFAGQGALVTAVDCDMAAMHLLTSVAGVATECRDLEKEPWPYEADSFDAVIVCNYLWRPTLPDLLATIRSNGVFLYETFMDGNEQYGKPSNPNFLLRPNELFTTVALDFQVIAFEQRLERTPSGSPFAVKQKIAAIKL